MDARQRAGRARARRGRRARVRNVDSVLLWRLAGGKVHATDATNASRTMLYDSHRDDWCDALLALLRVPRPLMPDVMDCAAERERRYGGWSEAVRRTLTRVD